MDSLRLLYGIREQKSGSYVVEPRLHSLDLPDMSTDVSEAKLWDHASGAKGVITSLYSEKKMLFDLVEFHVTTLNVIDQSDRVLTATGKWPELLAEKHTRWDERFTRYRG